MPAPSSRLRVLYDHYTFVKQQRGGVSRYFAHLLAELHRDPELRVDPSVALRWTDNEHLLSVGMVPPTPGPRATFLRKTIDRAVGGTSASPIRIPRSARDIDLIHSTAYKDAAFRRDYPSIRGNVRHVVTIHDMIPEVHGSPHLGKAWFARNADGLIFGSEASRADFTAYVGQVDVPSAVIPYGIDDRVFRPEGERREQPVPFIAHVGARGAYKRFDVLLAALGLLDVECRLVTIGPPFSAAEHALAERCGVSDRIDQITDASDADLAAWLRGATAFVSTSAIEGFGIPAIEAMACATPAVLADTRIYREVGGAAALYFEEGSAESLAEVLRSLLAERGRAAQVGASGALRASRLTWSSTAARTAAFYREVASA